MLQELNCVVVSVKSKVVYAFLLSAKLNVLRSKVGVFKSSFVSVFQIQVKSVLLGAKACVYFC